MKVRNRASLIDWLYKHLGAPAVKPPIASTQLDNCIDEALDYYTFHAGGTGHEEQYVVITAEAAVRLSGYETIQHPDDDGGMCLTTGISAEPLLVYKQEYQLPRDVVAVGNALATTCGTESADYATEPMLERGFALTNLGIMSTGIGGLQGAGFGSVGTALWTPGSFGQFNSFGSRGGEGTRGAGGGADIIGYELGMQYLEMIQQRYTIKLSVQFMEESKKVRFSPAPRAPGHIVLPVWMRVQDSDLYENIWIRRYAAALCKIQIGTNVSKYQGITFTGGATVNGEFYLTKGGDEKKELEEQIKDGTYSYPPGFYFA